MHETVETLIISTKAGPVRINASDFDPATMKLATPEIVQPIEVAPVAVAPEIVQKFVAKKGKGFVVTDSSGKQIDPAIYDSEDSAWASTLPTT